LLYQNKTALAVRAIEGKEFGRQNMRKLAVYVVLASITLSNAALAGQDPLAARMIVAQVGVGTPDCHTQGTLYRMANHCPPEAIAQARQQEYSAEHLSPPRRHHRHRHAAAQPN
jgi:hypothetical protein